MTNEIIKASEYGLEQKQVSDVDVAFAEKVKERERLAKIEADKQAELNKGDAAKVKDLIADLEALKAKYTFKSAKNKKMYADVSLLIDKVVNHIEN